MSAARESAPYWLGVGLVAIGCALVVVVARRRPGPWTDVAARVIGVVLVADAVSYTIGLLVAGSWSARTSLPLALCNASVLVAAAACWWQVPLLVELTWFWGIAGALQALITPDLDVAFPGVVVFEYLVGHAAIVTAALLLVVGMGFVPRPRAVPRVAVVTFVYTAFVGLVDWLTGANYMFLRSPPEEWTLLRLLGPWPWYLVTGSVAAVVVLIVLDAPFWPARRRSTRAAARRSWTPGEDVQPGQRV